MRLLGQMTLVALVVGASVTTAATERLTLSLMLTGTVAWSFVPLIQLATGLWLTRRAGAGRRVRALERYFDTHVFWSLWILAAHAVFLVWPPSRGFALLLVPTGVLPGILTGRALVRLCREDLGMPVPAARRAVAVHQGSTYVVVIAYAGWASAYLPRIVGLFA